MTLVTSRQLRSPTSTAGRGVRAHPLIARRRSRALWPASMPRARIVWLAAPESGSRFDAVERCRPTSQARREKALRRRPKVVEMRKAVVTLAPPATVSAGPAERVGRLGPPPHRTGKEVTHP